MKCLPILFFLAFLPITPSLFFLTHGGHWSLIGIGLFVQAVLAVVAAYLTSRVSQVVATRLLAIDSSVGRHEVATRDRRQAAYAIMAMLLFVGITNHALKSVFAGPLVDLFRAVLTPLLWLGFWPLIIVARHPMFQDEAYLGFLLFWGVPLLALCLVYQYLFALLLLFLASRWRLGVLSASL